MCVSSSHTEVMSDSPYRSPPVPQREADVSLLTVEAKQQINSHERADLYLFMCPFEIPASHISAVQRNIQDYLCCCF